MPLLLAMGVVLAVWQVVVVVANPHVSVLPSPWQTATAFWALASSGELLVHAATSLMRVLVAWILASVVALPIGIAMGRSRRFDFFVAPLVELFRPISPLAWIPMAILWFGISEAGKVFVLFIATLFPTLLNTAAGTKEINPSFINAARVLGCRTELSVIRHVVVPAALPSMVVGLRLSFGAGWMTIIAAELVAANRGLGYLISDGMEILRSDHVLVGMITIGLIGVSFDAAFRAIHGKLGWRA